MCSVRVNAALDSQRLERDLQLHTEVFTTLVDATCFLSSTKVAF